MFISSLTAPPKSFANERNALQLDKKTGHKQLVISLIAATYATALAKGVPRTMMFAKLRIAAALCGVVSLGIGTGGLLHQTRARPKPTELGPVQTTNGRGDDSQQRAHETAREQGLRPESVAYLSRASDDEVPTDATKRTREIEAEAEAIRKANAEIRARRENLLVNGSFEEGPETPNDGVHNLNLDERSTAVKGWVLTRRGGGPVDDTYWTPAHGKRSWAVTWPGGDEGGAVSQTFDSRKGQKYRLTFYLAGDPLGGPQEKKLKVSAAGQSVEFISNITGKDVREMGWVRKWWTFTAHSQRTTLEFSALSKGIFGSAIDDVVVTAIGE
jgi:choice-of-anchor C domain-containing protein